VSFLSARNVGLCGLYKQAGQKRGSERRVKSAALAAVHCAVCTVLRKVGGLETAPEPCGERALRCGAQHSLLRGAQHRAQSRLQREAEVAAHCKLQPARLRTSGLFWAQAPANRRKRPSGSDPEARPHGRREGALEGHVPGRAVRGGRHTGVYF